MNIIFIIGFWETPTPLLIILYCSFGNLKYLNSSDSPITRKETKDILFQTLTALIYLYPRGVTYRDLKPENIFIESRNFFSIKLADFGLANDKFDLKIFYKIYY